MCSIIKPNLDNYCHFTQGKLSLFYHICYINTSDINISFGLKYVSIAQLKALIMNEIYILLSSLFSNTVGETYQLSKTFHHCISQLFLFRICWVSNWPFFVLTIFVLWNPTIYNIICWFSGLLGQMTPRSRVWCSKHFFS